MRQQASYGLATVEGWHGNIVWVCDSRNGMWMNTCTQAGKLLAASVDFMRYGKILSRTLSVAGDRLSLTGADCSDERT